ncbi:MAG: B12-binding domain-containing radical SAM protein, partial [Candidatus Omnitrophica bacterium]|nr:B12-binding domain-containing radical SAM protein [Candidatus Omnitrophota bacterium]
MDDYLLQSLKPGRYIGEEWNISPKDFLKAEVKFALCFPDLYEVGMSNLGIRILYGILNQLPGVCCERFFSPATDREAILRSNQLEFLSLESKRSLREFDLVGFSLGYELSYTNVLNILDLGKIPLKSALRDASFPLIIA